MGDQRWIEVTIKASPEAQEATANALIEQGAGGVVETSATETTAYFAMDEASFAQSLERLEHFLKQLPQYGLDAGPGTMTWRVVHEKTWADAWKEYFHPQHIGDSIVIRPSWHDYRAKPGEIVVDLDPGMAFGTGLHPTTRLCIRLLEQVVRPGMSVFDIGTGSGILSVVAAKLGASRVVAIDTDSVAVSVATENVALNGVSSVVSTKQGSWPYLADHRPVQIVVANILAEVIIDMAKDVAPLIVPGGEWIASGIIAAKEDDVKRALQQEGWLVTSTLRDGDWVALHARPTLFR